MRRDRPVVAGRLAMVGLLVLLAAVGSDRIADETASERVDALDPTTSTSVGATTAPAASPTAAPAVPAPVEAPPSTAPHPTAGTQPPPSPPAPSGGLAAARVRLTQVASVAYPIAMTVYPGDGSLWIATKSGKVCQLQGADCVSSQTVASVSTGNEQGLLGIAFNPAGTRFYASYTDTAGDTRLDELGVAPGGAPDLAARRVVFVEDQPESNHNGGHIVFGPDGRLYLGLGDGGGAGDQHGSIGNAQDPATDLGKILRIDPTPEPPVVERWISGVRNPWRFSFDRATGDLWVGDVGQNQWEEVTYLPAGAQAGRNLGWRCFEGTHAYSGCSPAGGHTGPIFEYSHAEGCSITGGHVYRGARIPALVGAYLFADYCDGEVRALTQSGGVLTAQRRLGVDPGNVVSFGQDSSGELYVLTPSAVLRVDPA